MDVVFPVWMKSLRNVWKAFSRYTAHLLFLLMILLWLRNHWSVLKQANSLLCNVTYTVTCHSNMPHHQLKSGGPSPEYSPNLVLVKQVFQHQHYVSAVLSQAPYHAVSGFITSLGDLQYLLL